MSPLEVNGVLLLYNHPLTKNAPTIMDHVNSFGQYSRFKVWKVNTECGFPKKLKDLRFKVIVLHYSLFGFRPILNVEFLKYLEDGKESYKIAFFQDEHRFCRMRFGFLNRQQIDCVFTLVESHFFKDTYEKYTSVPRLVYCLPGYVSDSMLVASSKYYWPDEKRTIDIGYRGRKLDYYMGKGAQEKYEIAVKFREKASGLGLKLNIEADESKRIYGEKWYRFSANCRGMLGVEAGVSIFDVEDIVYENYQRLMALNPKISFEEMSEQAGFKEWEDHIYYRTISPRHFEAAAFRVCQILFEGKYSGIMRPMVHYIPLKKDFSNFHEVIEMFKNSAFRKELTENAFNDLIASGLYTYKEFVRNVFDEALLEAGLRPEIDSADAERVAKLLGEDFYYRQLRGVLKSARRYQFPGRSLLVPFVKPVLQKYDRWKEKKALSFYNN
ncbi:MAG: hypothetical protein ACFFBD_14875 [Candidatus Hodarchaeota archaeon]